MKIAFIHRGRAIKPELEIYRDFFQQAGHESVLLKTWSEESIQSCEVEWHFMGLDRQAKPGNRIKVHEYTSLSIPPFAYWKNHIKKRLASQPDLRVFGSPLIAQVLNFRDGVPAFFRDAGIGQQFFQKQHETAAMYDFVYCGAMDRTRQLHRLLNHFIQKLPEQKLLLVGEVPPHLKPFLSHPNFYTSGKVPYPDVPRYLLQARYAINFIPDVYPYHFQRPLKLLEYCALGMPVVSTDYAWVRQFEAERKALFFKIKPDFSNFTLENVQKFRYSTPDVRDLSWENILASSGILPFLEGALQSHNLAGHSK
ncbi:MAG TPA: glycosyltransferase [Saprospiraceae bacterium]|nr:glycosyltransferase [Saprospiraceae bacterium]HMQ82611.1 glycosyltransferase [Saprospiraceae bacterium]